MNRIIISEVDLTSNVESLSSYDVAYVPGFATNSSNLSTLYRVPTLYTNKYTFLNDVVGSVLITPTFSADQEYPRATTNTNGFPSWAIPQGDTELTYSEVDIVTFEEEEDVSDIYYDEVNTSSANWGVENVSYFKLADTDEYFLTTDTAVIETKTYYTRTGEEGSYTYEKVTEPQASALSTYYERKVKVVAFDGDSTQVITDYVVYKTKANCLYGLYTQSTTNVYKNVYQSGATNLDLSTTYYEVASGSTLMFSQGDADPGFRYALYLLSMGMPVYYEVMNNVTTGVNDGDNNGITIQSMYEGLDARFSGVSTNANYTNFSFDSMSDYSIKYITTGGYPVYEYGTLGSTGSTGMGFLTSAMIDVAQERTDSVALIDHTNNQYRTVVADTNSQTNKSVINCVRNDFANADTTWSSYGAMFTPWFECNHTAVINGASSSTNEYSFDKTMPASLAFLTALANQVKNYNPWLAVAGITRGKVPNCSALHTIEPLTNNIADSYQALPSEALETTPISINPITYIRNYGYCIWGNRTLKNNASGTTATSFLSIRDVTSDIKKTLFEASQQLLFEQNSDVLWINFKSAITPLLDKMVSNYILSDYKIVKYNTDPETGEAVPAYKVLALIRIMPINSVEQFDLTVQLENSDISVAETE